MTKQKEKSVDVNDLLDDIFSDVPYDAEIEVTLPSGKTAKIRPITFEEEKQILSLSKKGGDPSFVLIDKCVSDIDKNDILLIDKVYLLFKLRELSFGSMYKFIVGCPSCHKDQDIEIDLNDMPVVPVEDFQKVVDLELPISKKTAKVRLASVQDERWISDPEVLLDNLWRFVEDFHGHDNTILIQGAIKRMTAGDVNKLVSTVMCDGYGLSTEVRVICPHCNSDTVMELPLGKNFFSVS
jgi:hypothetical protein